MLGASGGVCRVERVLEYVSVIRSGWDQDKIREIVPQDAHALDKVNDGSRIVLSASGGFC